MYFPDSEFDRVVPDVEDALWRYIDFTQFVFLVEKECLWLPAASTFTDRWEGGLTSTQIERISENLPSFLERGEESVEQLYDALRATTYISCWHHREQETAAMWEFYNDRGKEVAIKSSVEELRSAIQRADDLVMGNVNYENYDSGGDLFPVTRNSPFFHKRLSFQHEQEFRIVKSEFNLPERAPLDDGLKDRVQSGGEPGRRLSVDVGSLIDEVVISPVVGGWVQELVEEVLSTHELEDSIDVSESKLRGDPFTPE